MAITLADFTKIWASTSPLTPYSFSESNYKEGWNFIGGTPPSRQMWDSIQNQNDEKLKYIVDNFLPTAGGTMTGAIAFDSQGEIGFRGTTHTEPAEVCKQVVVTAGTVESAWNDGNAKLCLHTYDSTGTNTAEDGGFALQTSDGTNAPYLEGKPNGDLKWSGKSIERVNASGSNYIRYESGIQICWESYVLTQSGNVWTVITFPVAFKSGTVPSASISSSSGSSHYYAVNSLNNTSFKTEGAGNSVHYIAVGLWK